MQDGAGGEQRDRHSPCPPSGNHHTGIIARESFLTDLSTLLRFCVPLTAGNRCWTRICVVFNYVATTGLEDRGPIPPFLVRIRENPRLSIYLEAQPIVHGERQVLLRARISLRRLQ